VKVTEIEKLILENAIVYGMCREEEIARDVRNKTSKVQESTVLPRTQAQAALRRIEELVKERRAQETIDVEARA
jgi:hypothetical protein